MKIHQKSGGIQWNIIKTVRNISSVSDWKTSQVELSFSEELQTFPMIVSKIPLGNGEFSSNCGIHTLGSCNDAIPLAVEQTGGVEKGRCRVRRWMSKEDQMKPIIITSQPCVKLDLP